MTASACIWTDGAVVAAFVNKDDAVTGVDAVAGAKTEVEDMAPARSDDAFPISNYYLQMALLLETRGRFLTLVPYVAQRFHKALVKVIPVAKLPVRLNNN
jgi:hypothetical protein